MRSKRALSPEKPISCHPGGELIPQTFFLLGKHKASRSLRVVPKFPPGKLCMPRFHEVSTVVVLQWNARIAFRTPSTLASSPFQMLPHGSPPTSPPCLLSNKQPCRPFGTLLACTAQGGTLLSLFLLKPCYRSLPQLRKTVRAGLMSWVMWTQ